MIKLKLGYQYILTDLDNTLTGPYEKNASQDVKDLISKFVNNGFNVIILSNNRQKRVSNFVKPLNVPFLYQVKKPKTHKLQKYLNENNIDTKKCLIIGDQIMTDILMANRLNIDSVLVNRLTKIDQVITIIPRFLDRYFRRKLKKKKLLKEF